MFAGFLLGNRELQPSPTGENVPVRRGSMGWMERGYRSKIPWCWWMLGGPEWPGAPGRWQDQAGAEVVLPESFRPWGRHWIWNVVGCFWMLHDFNLVGDSALGFDELASQITKLTQQSVRHCARRTCDVRRPASARLHDARCMTHSFFPRRIVVAIEKTPPDTICRRLSPEWSRKWLVGTGCFLVADVYKHTRW